MQRKRLVAGLGLAALLTVLVASLVPAARYRRREAELIETVQREIPIGDLWARERAARELGAMRSKRALPYLEKLQAQPFLKITEMTFGTRLERMASKDHVAARERDAATEALALIREGP